MLYEDDRRRVARKLILLTREELLAVDALIERRIEARRRAVGD